MAGEAVPQKPAEQKPSANAKAETKLKERLLKWAEDIAGKVIQAAFEDTALHFLDNVDDEESNALDLKGEYDPIVDQKTGARLSEAIVEFAEEIKQPEKVLKRLFHSALKAKWKVNK